MKTVATYTAIVEAQTDQLVLTAHRIDSVLLDENNVTHQPLGVYEARLQVNETDWAAAKELVDRQREGRVSHVKASHTRTRKAAAAFLAGFVVAALVAVTAVQLFPVGASDVRSQLVFALICGVFVGAICAVTVVLRARRV